ncbi:MAG: asparagine synthase (glutamine-hydrolyzing) [Novosphingobium sp.]|nr:asparagine synthase (glutamine-hydrolyzing) [Novosphingobium sp.]
MCGIAGLIDRRGGAPEGAGRILSAMSAAIARRGPDGTGVWSDSQAGVHFAHRRLSIIDLSEAGAQPMASGDGRVVLCYNGMLYNAAELRGELEAAGCIFRGHSDTEVIANGFARWGAEATLTRLNGMFAFAAWWRDERRLVLARDRLGKKPLYWGKVPGGIAWSSELPSLCCHPAIDRTIDRGAAAGYLRTGHVPDPLAIIVGAKKLAAGTMLTLSTGEAEPAIAHWWSLGEAVQRGQADPLPGRPKAALDEAARLIDDAVARRMVSDVPFGAFLSGGVDSSLVVARMQALSTRPVSSFAIGYKEAAYDESREAEAVARHLRTEHQSFILAPCEVIDTVAQMPAIYGEPFADPSAVPSTILAERARRHVTVVLTGDGGDEVFAGYNRYAAARGLLAKLDHLPLPLRKALGGVMAAPSPAAWDRLFALVPAGMRPRSAGEKLHKLAPLLSLAPADRYRQITSQWLDVDAIRRDSEPADPDEIVRGLALLDDPVEQLRFLDLLTYLPGDILTKVDRATMACGLEARAPLLDYRLAELSFRLPTATLMRGGRTKWILRTLLERDVPRALFERPKSGFGIPIGDWLRGPMRDWAENLLSVQALEECGLVKPAAVRATWEAHLSGRVNAQYGLWTVLMLQSWRGYFAGLPGDQDYGGAVPLVLAPVGLA